MLTEDDLEQLIRDRAIRLLVLGSGKHIWEASPSPLHQMVIDEIRASIRTSPHRESHSAHGCGCHHLSDVYIRLPDTSLVRPDISLFCTPPPRQREALQLVPQAVIEVISPGYEAKDLEDLPPVYLANGVLDVLALDVDQQRVSHFRRDGAATHSTPLTLELECGCTCTLR
ncbi:MAG TPA: Uma2 family endonuclease [Roseiflexaceae bacterium]|nr:Uma2 family endonuclease [Roseiflexaceae bacterium]